MSSTNTTEGVKHDQGKNPLELLPFDALEEIGKVLALDRDRYLPRNWAGGVGGARVFGELLCHLFAWGRGQERDTTTGLSHLAHAGCLTLFLLACTLRNVGKDDRP